jgi:hypothetical protein
MDHDAGAEQGQAGTAGSENSESDAVQQPEPDDEDDDGGLPLTRRQALGGGAVALGAGLGGLYLGGVFEGSGDKAGTGRLPFSVWEGMRKGLRASPDHLPGTADDLVAAGDPEAIFEFVRDDIATQPAKIRNNGRFRDAVDGGPRGTLRSGMGTPRDKAELLASLLERAGYEATVVSYNTGLSAEQSKQLYFGRVSHEFDPGFDQSQLETWREQLDLPASSDGTLNVLDENGDASATLAERVRRGLDGDTSLESQGFSWNRGASGVPIVKFWAADDDSEEAESTAGQTAAEPTPSASASVRYADLFHPDETFGSLTQPNSVESIAEPKHGTVTVRLEAATADAPDSREELVSKTWRSDELAGRQVQIETLPGVSPFDKPDVRYVDIQKFVPSLAVQEPHADQETLSELSRVGDPFTLTGDRYAVEEDGTVRKNGEVVLEGEENPGAGSDEPTVPDAAETVDSLDVEADVGGYPTVRLRLSPNDGDGNTVGGLPGAAFEVTEADDPVGIQVESNRSAPRVLVAYDASISMEIAGFYEGERAEFRRRMKRDLESINPDATVEFEAVDSDAWANMAEAATKDADVIIYMSDGDGYSTGHTDAQETAVSEGPPAILLSITGNRYDTAERMAELSGGTHIATNDPEEMRETLTEYVGELEPQINDYRLRYRSTNQETDGTTRTVTVSVPAGDASESVSYEVPAASMDPRERRGLVGLYLTVETSTPGRWPSYGTSCTRLLGGYDPRTGDGDPDETDRNDAVSALFGTTVLSFEAAGVKPVVFMDDVLAGKLSVEPLHDAVESGDEEAQAEALSNGVGVISQYPDRLHTRLPDRTTEDSITYSTGLRTVLFQQRPTFGSDEITRSVDILTTAAFRTLTRDGNRGREFRLTMDRTARYAVVERALFGTSTASLLDKGSLEPTDSARGEWSDGTTAQFDAATTWRAENGNDYTVGSGSADTAAHWTVDSETGYLLGVLPDGSGGSSGVERIKSQLKRTKKASLQAGLLLDTAPAGAGMGAMGAIAAYQQLLAELYALASISVATMSASDISREAKEDLANFVCDFVTGLALDDIPAGMVTLKANDINGVITGSSYGCADLR